MQFIVTCDGVPIGVAALDGLGMQAGRLATMPAFESFNLGPPARRLGVAFLALQWRRVPAEVGERAFRAAAIEMDAFEPRFGLLDMAGASVPAPRIALIDFPRRSTRPGLYAVVDLGEAAAGHVATLLLTPRDSQGARSAA
jgi:hypothetical protein